MKERQKKLSGPMFRCVKEYVHVWLRRGKGGRVNVRTRPIVKEKVESKLVVECILGEMNYPKK
jgi:hypothetical protein